MIQKLLYFYFLVLPVGLVYILQSAYIDTFKWHQGTYLLYGSEILLWIIFGLYLKNNFKRIKISWHKVDKSKLIAVVLIWLLTLWVSVSLVWSNNKELSLYWWFRIVESFALMMIVFHQPLSKIKWSLIFIFSGVWQSLLGIKQFLLQEVVANKWFGVASHLPHEITSSVVGTDTHRWLRAYGTFDHPNILGGFLVICLVFSFYVYFSHKPSWIKVVAGASSIIIATGIFFSFSRSAWLASLVVYLLVVLNSVYNRYYRSLFRLSAYFLILFISLFNIYQPLIQTRLSFDSRLENKSVDQRLNSLSEARSLISTHMFIGSGVGTYTYDLLLSQPDLPGWGYQPTHNIYLLIISELGLIGFLLVFVLGLYAVLLSLFNLRYNLINFNLLLVVILIGLFDHYFLTSYTGLILISIILSWVFKNSLPSSPVNRLINKTALEIGYWTGRDVYTPDYVSLVATFKCNFKCKTCDIWKKTDFSDEMEIDEWINTSSQLKDYLPKTTFVEVSGGEALLKKNLVMSLIKDLKTYFNTVVLNTNGSLITERIIRELELVGLDSLKISLYSLKADSHNFVRGTDIAFRNAMKAVELAAKSKIQLEVGVLITSYNVTQVPELVDHLLKYKNISVIIQPLDEVIESSVSKDMNTSETIDSLWPKVEDSKVLFDWLIKNNHKLKNSEANIRAMAGYYNKPNSVLAHRCFTGQRNIVIYPNGGVSLCFKRRVIGNVRKEKLKKIMKQNAISEREGIRKCGKYCRIVGCNFSRGWLEVVKRK